MSDEYLKFDIASIRARDEKYRTIAELDKNDCPREDRLELLVLHDALAAENARLREALLAYGTHNKTCGKWRYRDPEESAEKYFDDKWMCTCGFGTAVQPPEERM